MNENDLSIKILGKQNDKKNFCIRKCSKIEQKHFTVKGFFCNYTYNKQNLIWSDDAWSRQTINCNSYKKQLYFNFMNLAAHIILNLRALHRSE